MRTSKRYDDGFKATAVKIAQLVADPGARVQQDVRKERAARVSLRRVIKSENLR